jgi:hypothetical protein
LAKAAEIKFLWRVSGYNHEHNKTIFTEMEYFNAEETV